VKASNRYTSECMHAMMRMTHAINSMMYQNVPKSLSRASSQPLPTTHWRLITDSRLNSDEFSHSHPNKLALRWAAVLQKFVHLKVIHKFLEWTHSQSLTHFINYNNYIFLHPMGCGREKFEFTKPLKISNANVKVIENSP
jgi:hypothetical protein